jgi:hypothetical protein
MNTRFLGTICIVGSVVAALDALRASAMGITFDTISLITGTLWCIGGIAALIGLIRLNAVGSKTIARALVLLPMIGFVLLMLGNLVQLAGAVTMDNNPLANFGWLVQLAGMLVVGILVIAAKTWRGWRRFVPLLTLVLVPVSFGIGASIDSLALGAAIIYASWVLLGYVVATAEPTPALREAHA